MRGLAWIFLILLQQHGSSLAARQSRSIRETGPDEGTSAPMVEEANKNPSEKDLLNPHFARYERSGNYFHEPPDKSQKNLMSLARVSRAAKDSFMRFGRPSDVQDLYAQPGTESHSLNSDIYRNSRAKDNFMRFGKGGDNFMRFGRGGNNFMRFGRGKDSFIRFGREKDNFMRFGKKGDNFMRFGRGKDNFMRFGRGKDNFMRFGRAKDNFMRFGRGKDNFMRFGRGEDEVDDAGIPYRESHLLDRSGRSREPEADPEEHKIDEDAADQEVGDLDLQADKPKHGPIIRLKRNTSRLWEYEGEKMKREAELMEEIPGGLAKGSFSQKRFIDQSGYTDHDLLFGFPEDALADNPVYSSNDVDFNEDKRMGNLNNLNHFG